MKLKIVLIIIVLVVVSGCAQSATMWTHEQKVFEVSFDSKWKETNTHFVSDLIHSAFEKAGLQTPKTEKRGNLWLSSEDGKALIEFSVPDPDKVKLSRDFIGLNVSDVNGVADFILLVFSELEKAMPNMFRFNEDSRKNITLSGLDAIQAVYEAEINKQKIKSQSAYFFENGRILEATFYAKDGLFNHFLPEYEAIIKTLKIDRDRLANYSETIDV